MDEMRRARPRAHTPSNGASPAPVKSSALGPPGRARGDRAPPLTLNQQPRIAPATHHIDNPGRALAAWFPHRQRGVYAGVPTTFAPDERQACRLEMNPRPLFAHCDTHPGERRAIAGRAITVHVRVVPLATADAEQASRLLDEMERTTGLRGEPDGAGCLYVIEGNDPELLMRRIAGGLPSGWQDVLAFEV